MKFVFASDSFKGTLSSAEIGAMLCESARAAFPDCDCRSVTMADGGEGSVAAVLSAAGGRTVPVRAHDPLGGAVDAFYGVTDGGCAVIETAAASGLTLIDEARRDILAASSYGTCELIAHALDAGYADITLALGGSATNDGGAGAMAALGAR
ncbi:MAG: glycerate kinase, partial [Clostridiales bacterium]|nr:glycerate kinase [Clostridiales bacterium]